MYIRSKKRWQKISQRDTQRVPNKQKDLELSNMLHDDTRSETREDRNRYILKTNRCFDESV